MEDIDVLRALAKIKAGDTLCSDLTIVDHKTWFSSLKRFFAGDTRYNTTMIIEDAVNSFCERKNEAQHLTTREIAMLEKVRRGLNNLSDTYSDVSDVTESLKNCDGSLKELILSKPELSEEESIEEDDKIKNSSSEFEEEKNLFKESSCTSDFEGEKNTSNEDEEEKAIDTSSEPVEGEIILYGSKSEEEEKQFEKEAASFKDDLKPSTDPDEFPFTFGDSKPASKFESYLRKSTNVSNDNLKSLKKKNCEYSRPTEQSSKTKIAKPPTRYQQRLHIVTMGDVLSKIDSLPETLSNPLPASLSKNKNSRNIVWYEEKFIPR